MLFLRPIARLREDAWEAIHCMYSTRAPRVRLMVLFGFCFKMLVTFFGIKTRRGVESLELGFELKEFVHNRL